MPAAKCLLTASTHCS